jgi:hypothetical protein
MGQETHGSCAKQFRHYARGKAKEIREEIVRQCDISGFPGNATVEWCVIVVFPQRNNENKCLLITMKTFQRNNGTDVTQQ